MIFNFQLITSVYHSLQCAFFSISDWMLHIFYLFLTSRYSHYQCKKKMQSIIYSHLSSLTNNTFQFVQKQSWYVLESDVQVEMLLRRCGIEKKKAVIDTCTDAHIKKGKKITLCSLGHCYLTPSHPPTQQGSQPLDTIPFSPHSCRRIQLITHIARIQPQHETITFKKKQRSQGK